MMNIIVRIMKRRITASVLYFSLALLFAASVNAAPDLPRIYRSNLGLKYKGAFRIKNEIIGDSRIGYTSGEFGLTPGAKSFFVTGHTYNLAIAEYPVPTLNGSKVLSELPMVTPTQPFVSLLPRVPSGNPDGLDRITGVEYTAGGALVVNWLKYYDAGALSTDTTLVVKNPSNLNGSPITGFHKLEHTGHITGWASEVPPEWQASLDTKYLFGWASNYPINLRSSMGPSAFAVDMAALLVETGYGKVFPSTPFLDYPLDHRLMMDAYNTTGENDLWTEISLAKYGFIVPGTSTYMVLGFSGGHESGIGYKIHQNNGNLCGGACAYDFRDYYNYVWFYDVKDMLAVKAGTQQTWELRPYDYGKLDLPFKPSADDQSNGVGYHPIGGADYDVQTRQLFILIKSADNQQGPYERPPVMLVYEVPEYTSPPNPPHEVNVIQR